MTQTQKQKRSVVPLVEGTHDNLKVVRLDGDQFIVTAQQAIDACSLASDAVRFQTQFQDLLDLLYEWVGQRKSRVSSVYISIGQDGIKLLVVQKDTPADFDLEDELVELDLKVANEEAFDLIPFNTLLVPKVGTKVLQSFLSSSGKVMSHKLNAEQG
jgi:hypothetical protein